MQAYAIREYQAGYEQEQARIGREVARPWIWPYAYEVEQLLELHARADFDPATRHYCFAGETMVGYAYSVIRPPESSAGPTSLVADLEFPRMMPGHEAAAELLVERALETLRRKGVSRVLGRVTTMCPGDIRLAEKMGFSISDWGYKVYYSYEMGRGKLDVPGDAAEEVDPQEELDECAELAARWYGRPAAWCRAHLEAWHRAGIIAHIGVRRQERLVAGCMTAANEVRPSTAANYYVYAPDEESLEPMLARVVEKCIGHGVHNVIADLVNEHRKFEPVYRRLGFRKVAEWARCEQAPA